MMEKVSVKLSQWYGEEKEILDGLAHEVANAETIEEMVSTKNIYQVQDTRVTTILETIKLVEKLK